MQDARRADITLSYNGTDISGSVADSLLSLTYTDNPPGELDDLQISLEDRARKWQGAWTPEVGDTITARIKTINWGGPGEFKFLPLGTFEVDAATFAGPPDVVQIKALSLPAGTGARREARTKAWEKLRLKAIAADIAQRAKLSLLYDVPDNPLYERLDQTEQPDLAFLLSVCSKEGIAVKVSDGKLVLFDESTYEKKAVVATITRGVDAVISYSFGWSSTDAVYRAAELSYTDAKRKKDIRVTYRPPGAPAAGPVLKLNESAKSEAEALRIAKNRLREQNKNFGQASLQLAGDVRLAAGLTINIADFGRYDGKYIIDRATHAVSGGGYGTSIDIRKVLGW